MSNNALQSVASTKNAPKDTVTVLGIPAVSILNGKLQVGDARSSMSQTLSHPLLQPLVQAHIALTPPSKPSVMAPLVPSYCAIGTAPFPPILPSPPCSVAAALVQSGLENV